MRLNCRSSYLTVLSLSALVIVALAFAPRAAISTPPEVAGKAAFEAGALSDSVTLADLASAANEVLGLAASEVVTLDIPDTPGVLMVVDVPIAGELLTLDLVPHSVRSGDYRVLAQIEDGSYVEMAPQPVRTLRGTVFGFDESVVAGSLLEDGLYARIILFGEEEYWIEPIASRVAGAVPGQYVVYHRNDIIPSGGSCGADALQHPALEEPDGLGLRDTCGSGILCVAELAIDADYQYYQAWGSVGAVENRVNSVINAVNVQYERDVEIAHLITTIIVRTSLASNPYTTSDPSSLLNQFRSYWLSNHSDIQRDMAELFTGRNLDGSVIGIAWLNAVCTSNGYSVVQSDCCGSFACATDLSAHEMGHNWGADHCSCSSYTMNAGLTCSNQFHATYTIPEIVSFRTSRQYCLDADPGCTAPHFITQPQSSDEICFGEDVVLFVDVDLVTNVVYQWRLGQTDLSNDGHFGGVNTDTLTIFDFGLADEASTYNCVVTYVPENCSTISSNAELLLDNQAPIVTFQPQDQNVDEGDSASFVVVVENAAFFSFQWRKNGDDLADGGRVAGATTQVLMISNVVPADEGSYDCVVTSLLGGLCSATSDAASLTVNPAQDCPGDLDGDLDVDLSDLSQLLAHYGVTSGATPEQGDMDGDGDVDLSDLSALLAVYGSPCP